MLIFTKEVTIMKKNNQSLRTREGRDNVENMENVLDDHYAKRQLY